MTPVEVLRSGGSLAEIGAAFDSLSNEARRDAVREFKASDQKKLYNLAHGNSCSLTEDFVPPKTDTRKPIIHWGKNSLPLFKNFQKVMCKPSQQVNGEVAVGYNDSPVRPLTGPGYFIISEAVNPDGAKQIAVDYTQLPKDKSDGWPKIISNKARLSLFVYNGLKDFIWKVSEHVVVSRASRNGKWMNAYFMLARDEAKELVEA